MSKSGRIWAQMALVVMVAVFSFTGGVANVALMHDWILSDPNGDLEYRALGSKYTSVGWVTNSNEYRTLGASGVLIRAGAQSGFWVLTAAHVVLNESNQPRGSSFYFGTGSFFDKIGTGNLVDSYYIHPGYNGGEPYLIGVDLALLHLSTPVLGVDYAERFYGTDERGTLLTRIGYGKPGTVSTGIGEYDGIKRGSNNIGVSFGMQGQWTDFWRAYFAWPGSSEYQRLGAQGTSGDSGGGSFAQIDGTDYLVGISSWVFGVYSYGYTFSIRTSLFNDWIDETIANYAPVPLPLSAYLFGTGLIGLGLYRWRREGRG